MTIGTGFISSIVPENPTLQKVSALIANSPPQSFVLANRVDDANWVLLADNGYISPSDVLRACRQYKQKKIYAFWETDWPFAVFPGLYPSLLRSYPWARSWSYILPDLCPDDSQPFKSEREEYLFSFLGRVGTHVIRRDVIKLHNRETPCLDISEAEHFFGDYEYEGTYWKLLHNSLFVLCPRGFGVSSIRIFEAMQAGRVPVIISDQWVRPPVGDWDNFSIVVPERNIQCIPRMLARSAKNAKEMGVIAKMTYEQHFSNQVFLDSALATICNSDDRQPAFSRFARTFGLRECRALFL